MYAAAHLDLISAAVAEKLEGSKRGTQPARLPAAPARITTWGPRASRRSAGTPAPQVFVLPSPRNVDTFPDFEWILLDA